MRKIRAEDRLSDTVATLIQLQNKAGFFDIFDDTHQPISGITSEVLLGNAELFDLLTALNDPSLQRMQQQLASWLANTITTTNVFDTPETCSTRATFFTLASLSAFDPSLLSQSLLARAIRYLVTHEAAVSGPYKNEAGQLDRDTNMAIDRFVRQVAQPLSGLSAYIAEGQWDDAQSKDTWYAPARKHLDILCAAKKDCNPTSPVTPSPQFRDSIISAISHDIQTIPAPLRQDIQTLVDAIVTSPASNEIIALAAQFAQALPNSVPKDITNLLGIANTYTWIAYTLYDDFLDDEGKPQNLPLANIALRHGIAAFQQSLPDNSAFQKHIANTFDTIEVANAWETLNCRWKVDKKQLHIGTLPDYGDLHKLCERSLSHSLPIIGVLAACNKSLTSSLVRDVRTAFEEYLIIRQLSDDLRDWQEDIRAGHVSYVIVSLLQGTRIHQKSVSFTELMPRLEEQFWRETLPALSHEIQTRGQRARQLLRKHHSLAADNILAKLIQSLEEAAQHTLDEQQRADQFLQAYQQD